MGAIQNRRWSWGSRYDPATIVLLRAMTVRPSNSRAFLIDKTIRALKSTGIWAQLDLLYLLAAHDAQAAKLNWVSPASFVAASVNSPAFVADRGFTGDGATSRLRTQFVPSTSAQKMAQDNESVWVWVATNVSENGNDAGGVTAPFSLVGSRRLDQSGAIRIGIGGAGASNGSVQASSVGFSGGSRASATVQKAWKNGVQSGSDGAVNSTGLNANEQWMCAANSTTSFSTKQISAAAWGSSLSGKELSFYQTILAYMQGVGNA